MKTKADWLAFIQLERIKIKHMRLVDSVSKESRLKELSLKGQALLLFDSFTKAIQNQPDEMFTQIDEKAAHDFIDILNRIMAGEYITPEKLNAISRYTSDEKTKEKLINTIVKNQSAIRKQLNKNPILKQVVKDINDFLVNEDGNNS